MRNWLWRFGAILTLALLLGSCGSQSTTTTGSDHGAIGTPMGVGLPAPASLIDGDAARAASGVRMLALSGATTDSALPPRNATPSGSALTLTPSWTPQAASPANLALALYRFTVTGYYGAPELRLSFEDGIGVDECFVAIADFPANRWVFLPCPETGIVPLTQAQLANGTSPGMKEFLVIPVMTGTAPHELVSIRVGPDPDAFQLLGVTPTSCQQWDMPVMYPLFSGAEPASWQWNFGAATSPAIVNEMNPDPWFSTEGVFSCSVTATAIDGTPTTLPFTLTVKDGFDVAPIVTAIYPNSGHPGESTTLGAVTDGGYAQTYDWNFGGGATPNTSTQAVPHITFGAPGAYDCSVTMANAAGSSTYEFTLYVLELGALQPPSFFSASTTPMDLYAGAEARFRGNFTGGGPADSFGWDFGGACLPNTSIEAEPTVTLGAAGEYYGTLTAANAVGTSTISFKILIRGALAPEITGVTNWDTAYTALPFDLYAMVTGSPTGDWLWDFGGACVPNASTESMPRITPLAAGVYHCSVMTSNAAGSDCHYFDLTVSDPAVPDLTEVFGLEQTTGQLSSLSASNSGGASIDWQWSFPAGIACPNPTQPYPSVTVQTAGSYDCSVTATNMAGSSTFDFTIQCEDMQPPPIDSVSPLTLFTGQNATFFASTSCTFQMTWTWDFGGGCTPNTSTEQFPQVQALVAGTYTGVVTATNAAGTTTFEFTYTVQP